MYTHQLDVKTAFLNAPMTETVWVKPPMGSVHAGDGDLSSHPDEDLPNGGVSS